MRHFLYDDAADKAFIEHLKRENAQFREDLQKMQEHFVQNQQFTANLQVEIAHLKASPPPTRVVQAPLTAEDVAAKLGIPVHYVDQIDTARMGFQFQGDKSGN